MSHPADTPSIPPAPEVLRNATLPDGRRADIHLADGRVTALVDQPDKADGADRPDTGRGPAAGPGSIDLGGALVLPALVDGHAHLDKTLLGAPWQPHPASATLRDHIANERALRACAGVPVADRATALAHRMVSLGTGHVRSHVDIDPDVRLDGLHALVEVREKFRDQLGMQIVAFPQAAWSARRASPTSSTRHSRRAPT